MPRKHRYKIGFPALRERARGDGPAVEVLRSGRGPWAQWGNPRSFVWKQAAISIADLPAGLRGLRVLHLTDLHLGRGWGAAHDQLIAKVGENPPDLIFFTGDFVENRFDHRVGLPAVLRLFAGLKAKEGIYAIFGNHDPDVMLPYLMDKGIAFITHRRVLASTAGGPIELIGFPGPARQDLEPDFVRGLPAREAGVPRVVLSHYPDLFPAALGLEADLYLAGHTHGGQICLPNGWPPITHDRMPRRFCKGIHRIGRTWYSVNHGFGFTGIALRLFCPTEVVEFVLR